MENLSGRIFAELYYFFSQYYLYFSTGYLFCKKIVSSASGISGGFIYKLSPDVSL
ncbi:MAG TPA: hypothetical protein GX534_00265 [Thermoanaerobacterales bacterium]|jgi:hypothetical protein|nr:hypothetical protein [Thermoanaerobacterales bacterium]